MLWLGASSITPCPLGWSRGSDNFCATGERAHSTWRPSRLPHSLEFWGPVNERGLANSRAAPAWDFSQDWGKHAPGWGHAHVPGEAPCLFTASAGHPWKGPKQHKIQADLKTVWILDLLPFWWKDPSAVDGGGKTSCQKLDDLNETDSWKNQITKTEATTNRKSEQVFSD